MITTISTITKKSLETVGTEMKEMAKITELPKNLETNKLEVLYPDVSYIESTSRESLMEQCKVKVEEMRWAEADDVAKNTEISKEGLTDVEKSYIKEEIGWSDCIINNIENMEQYGVLKNAHLKEAKINGKECLINENIDLDYVDEDGITNRDRMNRGLAPLDCETGKPIELHHLGQKVDSPLVELTEKEHRTGVTETGIKNQSLWHNNTIESEVHGVGSTWNPERKAYWKARVGQI